MKYSQPNYNDFLTELKALDNFLLQRPESRRHVEPTDPDVRRLMESLAFFSTRSRMMASAGFARAVVRLASGHMEEILRSQPARALVQAVPDARMAESVSLPTGTVLRVQAETVPFAGAGQSGPTIALFRTMTPVTLWPLRVHQAKLSLLPTSGFRILVELRAHRPLQISGGPLSLHISNLDDYRASRRFLHALERHLDSVSIVYSDDEPEPGARGVKCDITYGRLHRDEKDRLSHPLARLGTFFHFPEIELFCHVHVPERERAWRRAWLCFDLDKDWPTNLIINKDIFQLFVLPVSNARREPAEPIVCDGTRDSYPLQPQGPFPEDSLLLVEGVYREVADGWQPLLPGHLASLAPEGTGTYEVEGDYSPPTDVFLGGASGITANDFSGDSVTSDDAAGGSRIILDIADAFENPCKVLVDAYWHQPWFDGNSTDRLKLSLQNRNLGGVGWHLRGNVRDSRPSQVMEKPFEILHLLALIGKTVLDLSEIKHVLRTMGADEKSVFGEAVDLLDGLRVTEQRARGGDGIEYVYRFTADEVSADMQALVYDLLHKLEILLDAWSWSPVSVIEELGKNQARKPAK